MHRVATLGLRAGGTLWAASNDAWLAQACYVVVALVWLVPDRRIEKALAARPDPHAPTG